MTKTTRFATIPARLSSWINHNFLEPSSSFGSFENLAPGSGQSICEIFVACEESIAAAVDLAAVSFETEWSILSAKERGDCLRAMASVLRENAQDLVEIEALDTGIPIRQIQDNHIPAAIETLEYYASLISNAMEGRMVDTPHAGGHKDSFAYTRREPIGVCVGIGAWNYPLSGMMWKVAPALACGNTMLFKPSECTPLSSLKAAELTKGCLPPNVLQIVTGDGNVAQKLIENPRIRKVSITGSAKTGGKVAEQAGKTLKHVTLELGGKSPMLVFADSDLESAVRVVAQGNFVNNGQVCSNCTRTFVEESIKDVFLEKLVNLISEYIVIGNNMDEATNMGPVMMPPLNPSAHFDRIVGMIERAKLDPNVDLVYGGNHYKKDGGYYIEPTIFVSRSDDAEILCEEVFGPVLTVMSFQNEEEGLRKANASAYGLAAGVMSQDLMRAHRVAKRLQAGVVYVNNWNLSPFEVPFGPSKMSGYGNELGPEALDEYSEVKSVYVEMGSVDGLW